jgi:hypothetical protein
MCYAASAVPVWIDHVDRRVVLLILDVRVKTCFFPHLFNLHVVVCCNTSDGNDKTADVDWREGVVEDEVCCADGDDFFEDATDAKCDDRCALQQRTS